MKKVVALLIAAGGIVGLGIIAPSLLISLIATSLIMVPVSVILDKIMYTNKNSKLLGINSDNVIQQRTNLSIFKNMKVKNKGKLFDVEMFNLLLDMKQNEKYETVSQNIVLRGLKKLEKLGYIDNLEYENDLENNSHINKRAKKNNNKIMKKVNSFLVNLGMGNFKNMTKEQKNYEINFKRTSKSITQQTVQEILSSNYEVLYNKKGGIKKIKFIDDKTKEQDKNFKIRKNTKANEDKQSLLNNEVKKEEHSNEFNFENYLATKKIVVEEEHVKTK